MVWRCLVVFKRICLRMMFAFLRSVLVRVRVLVFIFSISFLCFSFIFRFIVVVRMRQESGIRFLVLWFGCFFVYCGLFFKSGFFSRWFFMRSFEFRFRGLGNFFYRIGIYVGFWGCLVVDEEWVLECQFVLVFVVKFRLQYVEFLVWVL